MGSSVILAPRHAATSWLADYGDEWTPAALHKPQTVGSQRETDLLLGPTLSVMDERKMSKLKEAWGCSSSPTMHCCRFLVGNIRRQVWRLSRQTSSSLSLCLYLGSYKLISSLLPLSPASIILPSPIHPFIHPSSGWSLFLLRLKSSKSPSSESICENRISNFWVLWWIVMIDD